MNKLLEYLGIYSRKARPVGGSLESGSEEEEEMNRRRHLVAKGLIVLVLLVVALAAFPRDSGYQIAVQEGDIWRDENLVAPFDFPIYKTDEQLEEERRAAVQEVRPVFRRVPEVQDRSGARLDSVRRYLDTLFAAYQSWQMNRSRGQAEEAAADSVEFYRRRRSAPIDLNGPEWQMLLQSYAARVPGLSTTSRTEVSETPLDDRLIEHVDQMLARLYENHVIDVPIDSVHTAQIVVRDEQALTETTVPRGSLYGPEEARTYAQNQLDGRYAADSDTVAVGMTLFEYALRPSLQFMESETRQRIAQRQQQVSPIRDKVQEGQMIVRKGEVVTEEVRARLRSLERFRAERSGNLRQWKVYLGQFVMVGAILGLFFLYLYLLRERIFAVNRHVLLITLLFTLVLGLWAVAVRLVTVPMLAVPVGIAPILLTVLYDSRVGLVSTVTLALLGGAMAGFNFELTLATVFAGALAVFSVRDVRNRGQIVVSAGLAFAAYVAVIGAFALMRVNGWPRFQEDVLLVGINVVLLLFAHPLLWIIERTFNITTDLTLLELSDTNRPLLKELGMRAPGTFHHSLQVANLGEAAADAVGANSLLVRVGALYHDIGKMLKPEYFIENQRVGENPHDNLSPHMSALILASHVKDGLELGRQHGLPHAVLEFIPMHHGTALMEYFYRRALDQEKADESPVSEAEFRYPGPRPNSNETAILMLADSVEAACRSLEKPTPKKLETLVDSIFQARIEDGQLDHCRLTFADLETIKRTFIGILSSMHHVRVKYPGQEETGEEGEEAPPEAPEADGAEIPDVAGEELPEELAGNGASGTPAGSELPSGPQPEGEDGEPDPSPEEDRPQSSDD